MANSTILQIPQIAEGQNNKYLTHNDAVEFLEQAVNATYTNAAVGAGPVNLSTDQATRNFAYKVSGSSANFNLVFPSSQGGNNAKRVFAVRNEDTTYNATVKASTGAGATVVLSPGQSAICVQTYEDIVTLALSAPTTVPYDIGVYIPNQPPDNDEILKFVAVRAFSLADDFAGSRGHVGSNPTSTATFTVNKNGSSIGTIAINTSGVFTFATTGGSAETFAAGDRLSVLSPTPQDATLSDVSIVFLGTRTV